MQTASTTTRNIKAISELEHSALAQRSMSARIGDAIASHAGKMWFIVFHLIWFLLWLWLNSGSKSRLAFDPFPYQLLSTIVSLESIFLSLFILMSQNRSNIQADQRNHLDLQINLLSEEENTKMLQMLQAICAHHKLAIGKDPEIMAMTKQTEINEVLSELQEHLPATE
jgi:uncharacterized membrane protein